MKKSDKRLFIIIMVCGVITAYTMWFHKGSFIPNPPMILQILFGLIGLLGIIGIGIFPFLIIGYIVSLFTIDNSIPTGLEKFAE